MGERTNLKYLSLDKNNLVDLPINMKRMQVCMTVYVSSYLLYIRPHTMTRMRILSSLLS